MQKVWKAQRDEGLAAGDREIEQASKSVFSAGPADRLFVEGVKRVADYYRMEGYDLKAERILKQAIAMAEPVDVRAVRQLTEALGQHYRQVRQSVKAAPVYAKLLDDVRKTPEDLNPIISVLREYGQLNDQMGDLAEAEALFQELDRLKHDLKQPGGAEGMVLVTSGRRRFTTFGNPLADFYFCHGRTDEAEHVFKQAMEDKSSTPAERIAATQEYLNFLREQQRYEEAVGLTRQVIAELEHSADQNARQAATQERGYLAITLGQAGHKQEAAEVLQQTVDEVASTNGTSSLEYWQALFTAGSELIALEQFDAAEKNMNRIIEGSDGDYLPEAYDQVAIIRDRQKKPEEAEQFRQRAQVIRSAVETSSQQSQEPQIWNYRWQAQLEIDAGEFDKAMTSIKGALALAAQHPALVPEQVAQIAHLVPQLVSHKRKDDAIHVLSETISVMEQGVPSDHPRLARALAELAPAYESLGWTVEFERLIDRVESILIAAKGPDSPELDQADQLRIMLYGRQGDHRAAVVESQKMLARTAAAQGLNSAAAMENLRLLAGAFERADDWPREEAAWQDLLERSERGKGLRTIDHGQLLGEVAQAYARQHMYDKALGLNARAIEIFKALPNGVSELAELVQERESIEVERAKEGRH